MSVERSNRAAVAALTALLSASPLLAAVHPLSGGGATTDVLLGAPGLEPRVDPTGRWVVYLDDASSDGFFQLRAAPLDGGTPVLLTPGSPGDFITQFEIAPNGSYVALIGFFGQADGAELFTVPIGGGALVRRSALLDPGGYVAAFAISPDSQTLVYTVQTDPGRFDIVRVGAASGTAQGITFTDGSICTPQVDRFAISPDSAWLAFTVQHDCSGSIGSARDLHRVSLSGSSATLVAQTYDMGFIPSFGFTRPAQGQTPVLVYVFDLDGTIGFGGGNEPAKLIWYDGGGFGVDNVISGTIVTGGNVTSFAPIPGTQKVAFRADREVDQTFELYVVTAGIHGVVQAPTQLHGALAGWVEEGYVVCPDGSRVLFVEDALDAADEMRINSAAVASPGTTREHYFTYSIGGVGELACSVAGDRALFIAYDDFLLQSRQLFSSPLASGFATRLSESYDTLTESREIADLALSNDGMRVHYQSNRTQPPGWNPTTELLSVAVAGGAVAPIGPSFDLLGRQGFLGLWGTTRADRAVSVNDSANAGQLRLTLSDSCLLCDGFEGTGNGLSRWN